MTDVVHQADPIARLQQALHEAEKSEPDVPNAMVLATVAEDGRPSARVVLLKGVSKEGLVFYTNYRSRKGRELDARPAASLCIHWKTLGVQVRVEGRCERTSAEQSDAYFNSRPLGSRLGAWASDQSEPLQSRDVLEQRYRAFEQQYRDNAPPRPAHWGGYRLVPSSIEFWTHRDSRLHDRERYERVDGGWRRTLLNP